MASEEKKKELFEKLKNGVIQYDEDSVKESSQEALDLGLDANEAIFDGLVEGMKEVGSLFEAQEYFVPELLMCADALYAGLDILKPHVKEMDLGMKGSVVIGTVEGDVHDIGKNIVKMMFDVAGFNVYDLGRDVPLDKFVEEQIKTDSDLVCLSAMMTTTMVGMQKVIDKLKAKNPNIKIMIGGAPVSKELADKWGADGYAPDATNALKEAINMISMLKDLRDQAQEKKVECDGSAYSGHCSSQKWHRHSRKERLECGYGERSDESSEADGKVAEEERISVSVHSP
jgi:corrinoid protein of di/trimethylamine methyltransferase